jgi:hypothetical protein
VQTTPKSEKRSADTKTIKAIAKRIVKQTSITPSKSKVHEQHPLATKPLPTPLPELHKARGRLYDLWSTDAGMCRASSVATAGLFVCCQLLTYDQPTNQPLIGRTIDTSNRHQRVITNNSKSILQYGIK